MLQYGPDMAEGMKFLEMANQTERLKRFGHFEIVVQEQLSGERKNVLHHILPWVVTKKSRAEAHYFQRTLEQTDIGLNTPLYITHQYVPRNFDSSIYEGRAIIVINPNLMKEIGSATQLTRDGEKQLERKKLRRKIFMVNPEEGLIIQGRGLSGQHIHIELFWIPPGVTFEQLFPHYLESLTT